MKKQQASISRFFSAKPVVSKDKSATACSPSNSSPTSHSLPQNNLVHSSSKKRSVDAISTGTELSSFRNEEETLLKKAPRHSHTQTVHGDKSARILTGNSKSRAVAPDDARASELDEPSSLRRLNSKNHESKVDEAHDADSYWPAKLSSLPNSSNTRSDPDKHKRFVDSVLARRDENGVLKESWYGKSTVVKEKYTPLEVQVVELKARYTDVLLLIEVGYRFRFFGDDAETAARVLGIFAYYDHNFLTASIPTFRLHVHVRRLVEAGYKVGVIRQTETAAIKAHGSNKTGPFTRDLSALYTRSTLEAAADLGGEPDGKTSRLSSYLMCIVERPLIDVKESLSKTLKKVKKTGGSEGADNGIGKENYDTEFGVVAVETATGDVIFGSFNDSLLRTELEARLLTCSPAELLLATPLSSATEKLLKEFAGPASEVRIERVSRDCFKDGGALAEVVSFYGNKGKHENDGDSDEDKVNEGMEVVMAMPELVLQSLALALRYLKQFGLEKVLMLGAVFRPFSGQHEMQLSPNALRQLEILKNNADGTDKGSLLWVMDHTRTAFGARLLRHWVTHPLCDRVQISARLDAVAEIALAMGGTAVGQGAASFVDSERGSGNTAAGRMDATGKSLLGHLLTSLGKLPDLERGVTRIFHRTATAAEFVCVIQALVTAARQLQRLHFHSKDDSTDEDNSDVSPIGLRSPLLHRLVSAASSPAICEHASRLLSALNSDAAAAGDKLNLFVCTGGRFPEVAKWRTSIKSAEKQLEDLLPNLRKLLHLPNLHYLSVSGTNYLVEVPVAQRVPANWMKVTSTKKVHRYQPPEVIALSDTLAVAQEELSAACGRAWDMFLGEFSTYYVDFRASVQALAALDSLHSLAIVSRNQGYTRPEFVEENEPSQLNISAGRHPVLDATLQDGFVPNDTSLSALGERCQIITGPNMGGKSCYIRQVALIAIMAQVGSFVPAKCANLHVFDSVHTRMGASDGIQRGSSTFFEELSEASAILEKATKHSLVIVDELGRGTSTHDGVAIAYATLHYLLEEIQCLTLFVTHYPKIAELQTDFPGQVSPYYVSYFANETKQSVNSLDGRYGLESEGGTEGVTDALQSITFLYKLASGVASRSFGLHVARMAQIPEACILHAASVAAKLEKEVHDRKHGLLAHESDCFVGNKTHNRGEDEKCNKHETAPVLVMTKSTSAACPGTRQNSACSQCLPGDNSCFNHDKWNSGHNEPEDSMIASRLTDVLFTIRNSGRYDSSPDKTLSTLKEKQTQLRTMA